MTADRPVTGYSTIDQITETLESQGFEYTAATDNDHYIVTCWRVSKNEYRYAQVLPIKFYGLTLNAAFKVARDTLVTDRIVVCYTCGQETVGVVDVDGYPPGTCPFCFTTCEAAVAGVYRDEVTP